MTTSNALRRIIPSEDVLMVMAAQDQLKCYPYLRKRGQVTIPEEIRTALGIEEGDQLELTIKRV